MQLVTIREKEYTKGWEPDWENDWQNKYCICFDSNIVKIRTFLTMRSVLSFPTKELAEKFLNTWKDLIEITKPLL